MPDNPLTLSMLGGLEADASGLPISAVEREQLLTSMRAAVATKGFSAFDISERLLNFVGQAVRRPVAGVMGEVWRQRQELRDIAEKKKDKKDVEGAIELYDHSISCALHPSVELHVDGAKVGTITFDFKANLRLQGVQLVMKNAWITRIKAGKLTSTVTLEYEKIPLMPPCKKTIDMKQSILLPGGGIRLGGEETPPVELEKQN
jgi:hypothetical protein